MRTFSARALVSVSLMSALLFAAAPAYAQGQPATAADAAQAMASAMDGAGGGITSADQIAALETAAQAGDPMAQWQLGLMYESGEGVDETQEPAPLRLIRGRVQARAEAICDAQQGCGHLVGRRSRRSL